MEIPATPITPLAVINSATRTVQKPSGTSRSTMVRDLIVAPVVINFFYWLYSNRFDIPPPQLYTLRACSRAAQASALASAA